jgi:hypothetical protein
MNATELCPGTQYARQAQARIDAAGDVQDQIDAIHDELENDMRRALSGLQSSVPSTRFGVNRREVLSSAAEEVLVALDNMEVSEALMVALASSACPHVAKLRKLVIERYAKDTAEYIAEARGIV